MELMLHQPFQETSSLQDLQWPSAAMPVSNEKESIIANTDFKVCSGLARRRLSSKKRKKPMDGGQEGEYVAMEMGTSRSSHSPADGPSPIRDSNCSSHVRQSHLAAGYYQGVAHTLPAATVSGGVQVPGGQYVSMAQGFSLMPAPSIGMLSKQFSNPVHIQQELNYRFIQDQSTFVPALGPPLSSTEAGGAQSSSPQHGEVQPPSLCSHSGAKKPFKWCYAHVMVARQIHHHQMQIKASSEQPTIPRHHHRTITSLSQQEQHIQHQQHQQQHLQHQHLQHLQHQQQQQQQLLLLQMYSCLPQSGVVPSYVALPYPTLQDLQLGYLPPQNMSLAPTAPQVKPAPAPSSIPTTANLHMSSALHLAPNVTTLAPVPELTSVFPGTSWIAPVPVFGSCIVNPFHPGVLTSWVK